jgi:excisionase family DNA binding protein
MEPLCVDVVEAERRTFISRHTWRKYIRDGKVRAVRIGRLVRIPLTELERVVREGVPAQTAEERNG